MRIHGPLEPDLHQRGAVPLPDPGPAAQAVRVFRGAGCPLHLACRHAPILAHPLLVPPRRGAQHLHHHVPKGTTRQGVASLHRRSDHIRLPSTDGNTRLQLPKVL